MLALPPNHSCQERLVKRDTESKVLMDSLPGSHHRQYAYPAQTETIQRPRSRNKSMSFAEHKLRRKTPGGSISGAYDGTPTDGTVQIPAKKHVVLSETPDKRQSCPSNWTSRPETDRATYRFETSGRSQKLRSSRHTLNDYQTSTSRRPSTPDHTWMNRPSWDFPGGLDSVLNQELPFHPSQRYYVQNQFGSSIPTVRPLALQSWAGPTASASPELYGPYWPDGSFNPYRPAPTRDTRFYEQHPSRQSLSSSRLPAHPEHLDGQRYGQSLVRAWSTFGDQRQVTFSSSSFDTTKPTDSASARGSQAYISERQSHARTFHDTPWVGIPHIDGIPVQSPHTEPYQATPIGSLHTARGSVYTPLGSMQTPAGLLQSPASHHFAHREHTFAWAQSIYMQLVACIQQSQKANHADFDNSNKQSRTPAILLRPPRQIISQFQEFPSVESLCPPKPNRHQSYPAQWQIDSDPPRPSTAIFSPSRRGSDQANDLMHSMNPEQRLQSFSDHYNDKYRTIRRPAENRQFQTPTQNNTSLIQSNAMDALSSIETLCESSQDYWIDGMLLAGCLAYGLGEYYRAMKWYQTIMARDPRHVEAMSNLAATLLALNRREEAIGHWSAVVKLRPSYFEAVEHLIGLLCNAHRTKEAVAIIQEVEDSLRLSSADALSSLNDSTSEADSDTRSRTSSIASLESIERAHFDYETENFGFDEFVDNDRRRTGFGTSGFAIPGAENGRMLALIHGKGNMLYLLGDNNGAASAFEDAILIAAGRRNYGVNGLIHRLLTTFTYDQNYAACQHQSVDMRQPILLSPERALLTAKHLFPPTGQLPGLRFVPQGTPRKAAVATTSNSLLSLAKIYQDGMSNTGTMAGHKAATGTRDILALYYLSLSLQPSPSTANNVGILLASVQCNVQQQRLAPDDSVRQLPKIPGVVPESGVGLALAYYNFGLHLDKKHAHLYTNLGSLLKDIGQLDSAIKMYELAVQCDPKFDIALANLANAVKDRGQVADAIAYYRRAVEANPEFAEAVCGLATALNSVCGWHGRGGIFADHGKRDRIHVDDNGMLYEARTSSGWMKRVVDIVEKQLGAGEIWGTGCLTPTVASQLSQELSLVGFTPQKGLNKHRLQLIKQALRSWSGQPWEGSRVVRLIERAIRQIGWQWYQDRNERPKDCEAQYYSRPTLPSALTSQHAPTVLPFHTFTAPLSAKQIRQISQRNGLRISTSTLRAPWLPSTVYPPPMPPRPHLVVGYVSSDFNNHPLAHLMQSVFGIHDPKRVYAICYATTSSDKSNHRQQIEREAPLFRDVSSWSNEQLVNQVVADGVHILVNLNGYTRGARNEVFAARPAPIQMSFMGFAGTLGAEWSDYILADAISVPPDTLSPWRRNVDVEDFLNPDGLAEDKEDWVYSENFIFAKDTFFCCDHKQSAPDAKAGPPPMQTAQQRDRSWAQEQQRRWILRRELFPSLADNAIILGNFNQLYKIDPSTFRLYLRILAAVPHAILWLLRFPDLGEQNLLNFARDWAGPGVASRIIFTDVAPKGLHITRASVLDLFLDTPECNAHTTAADVIWSGTPVLHWGKWRYKMCSRMAGSIMGSALPADEVGDLARNELIVESEEQYEEAAIRLARGLNYEGQGGGGQGRLMELRRMLWEGRWNSRLFDTKRWVREVERAYWEAWGRWERGEGGDIWL